MDGWVESGPSLSIPEADTRCGRREVESEKRHGVCACVYGKGGTQGWLRVGGFRVGGLRAQGLRAAGQRTGDLRAKGLRAGRLRLLVLVVICLMLRFCRE